MDLLAHGLPPVPFGGQFDGHVAGALGDARGTAERPRPEALDGRALVDVRAAHGELVGAELVGRLGVGDGRVEQLEDVAGDGARSVGQDGLRLLDALAANVVHHEPRLARSGAHVLRARADYEIAVGTESRLAADGAGGGLGGAATPARLGLVVGRDLLGGVLVRIRGGGRLRARFLRCLAGRLLDRCSRGRRVVLVEARDQLVLLPGLGQAAGLELGLELVDGQLAPTPIGGLSALGAHRTLTLSLPAWPRNTRVGANSPSLWPTIDSEMKTGTCLRPSWTAIVWPTISGKIVDARDHVFSICLLPEVFIASIRASSRSSMYGPFLLERDMPTSVPSCRGADRAR